MASLYMTAMLQLGLMQEEGGQPRIDLIGARQTIDTLGLLAEKTKGNLTPRGRQFSAELPVRIAHGLRGSHQRAGPAPLATGTNPSQTMKATLTVLGSGTSMGVPTIGCDCAVCRSSDPHDRRTRPSMLIEYGGQDVCSSTPLRTSASRPSARSIRQLDAVLYTHAHADHILGIDDLRPLSYRHGPTNFRSMPSLMWRHLSAICSVIFSTRTTNSADWPRLNSKPLDGPVDLFGASFEPVTVIHGETRDFRIPLRIGGVSDRFQRRARGIVRAIAESRHPVSGCVAAQASSHAFDGGELAAHRGACETASGHSSHISATTCRTRKRMRHCRKMCGFRTTG